MPPQFPRVNRSLITHVPTYIKGKSITDHARANLHNPHSLRRFLVRTFPGRSDAVKSLNRYTIETTRRNSEEALRGAQAVAKELEAKHAGMIETSSSLMKQVEELREELAR